MHPLLRRSFSLTRYFLVAGVTTAVAVALAVSAFTSHEVGRELEQKSEDYAVLIARNVNRQVHERFVVPTVARDGEIDLDRPEHLAALDHVVRLAVAELGIDTVYFFDLQGLILYSTNLEHRGFVVRGNPDYDAAAAGRVATSLVERGSPLDVDGRTGAVPLLETYVPVERLDAEGHPTGERSGVIEVYQDATVLLVETRVASARVAAIATCGILALMLVLSLRIVRAERTLDERTAALVEVNERLAALSADLERQVEDRTRRLVRAETLASVGTLSAGVAHEINNPIASIASCAEGLLRRAGAPSLVADPAFEDFPDYLRIIRDEAFRVKDITRNLLDFARSGAGAVHQRGPVDLGALLAATARLVAYRVEGEGKRLEVAAPDPPVVIEGDAADLRQLLLNLTVNALDATAPGGRVRWTVAPAEVDGRPGGARLVCEDDGQGLDADALARALEPFYTRKPPGKGTGLGLSIAYAAARRHGGTLELESEGPGRGARVTVVLGEAPGPEAPSTPEPPAEPPEPPGGAA